MSNEDQTSSKPGYRYSAERRTTWPADILSVAADKPGHLVYARALADY